MLKAVSVVVLLVGLVVSGCVAPIGIAPCAPLVGTWLLDASRTDSPVLRPVTFSVHSDGNVSNVSGSNVVALGFTARGGLNGECSQIGPNLYRIMLEELLYRDGLFAGRFLVELTLEHDPENQTIAGVSGESRFKITVFSTTPPPAPPAPCLASADDLVEGAMVRESSDEHECRSATDIELTGRRIATDSFFTP